MTLNRSVRGGRWGRHERLAKMEWLVLAYCQKIYNSLEQTRKVSKRAGRPLISGATTPSVVEAKRKLGLKESNGQ